MVPKKPAKAPGVIKQPEDQTPEFADSFINTVREPLVALDQDLRVVKVSRSFYETFKVKPEETLGQHIYDLGNKQLDIPRLRELLEAILPQTSTFDDYEIEYDFPTIGRRTMLLNARQIQNALGKDQVILLAIEDITERRQAEKALAEKTGESLRASEEKYRILVENANDIVYSLTLDGVFTYVSPTWTRILGHDISEVENHPFQIFVHPEDLPRCLEFLEKTIKTGEKQAGIEYRVLHKDGNWRWHTTNASPIYDADGKVVAFMGIAREITKRKKAEEALRHEEALLQATGNMAKVGGWELDLSTNKITWTEEVGRIHEVEPGYQPKLEEALNFYAPESRPDVEAVLKKAAETGEPYDLESLFIPRGSKDKIWIRSIGKAVYSGDKVVKLIGTFQNIDKYKRAEEALQKSEERFRVVQEMSPDGFTILHPLRNEKGEISDFTWVYENKTIARINGTDPEEVKGKRLLDLFPTHKGTSVFEAYIYVSNSGKRQIIEEVYVGEIVSRPTWLRLVVVSMGEDIAILAQDITEGKIAEEKLLKSYESVKKTLNDAINTMVKIVELRDPYTAGHQQKVADLATAIAREMKLDDTRIDQLRTVAVLHDIGKMYIPSDILSKPGKLADIEFNLIKTHAQSGYDIVKGMDFPGVVAESVLQHHERLDGSGYPNKLKGEDTLLEAKILAVADVIEAMASHRPYRQALGIDKALEEISKNKGKLYDPDVVDTCLELFNSGRFDFRPV